jgi:hypothetical protein
LSVGVFSVFRLNSQFCASFDATTLDHSSATFSGNTCTKTVCTSAVTRMWLVGSFWHISVIVANFPLFDKPRFVFITLQLCNNKSYPHILPFYPQVYRGGVKLWISTTPICRGVLCISLWLWKTMRCTIVNSNTTLR